MSGGFEAMGLSPELQRGIYDVGYTLPTEVQDEAIPLILGGGDVMVAAPTGSGKTAAVALPMTGAWSPMDVTVTTNVESSAQAPL